VIAFANEKLETLSKNGAINSKGTPIRVQHSWTEGFQTNENNKKAADYIRTAAKPMILKYWKRNLLLGEDFGLFTQQYPGASLALE
jgi:hypothetical protein